MCGWEATGAALKENTCICLNNSLPSFENKKVKLGFVCARHLPVMETVQVELAVQHLPTPTRGDKGWQTTSHGCASLATKAFGTFSAAECCGF